MNKWGQSLIFDPDDTDRKSKRIRMIANVTVALVVAGGWFYSLSTPSPVHVNNKIHVGKLREEFQKIPVPEGVSAVDGLVVNSKSSYVLVEHRYAIQHFSSNLILAHYDRQLKNNGWSYFERYPDGNNGHDGYCKGPYEANIQFTPGNAVGNTEYSFAMSWSEVSIRECAARP